ncbi:Uncharacterised protein [Helicobacter cholecystus]|nr:Uncharacterised protein [Helicobacter cholecystus]
MAQTLNDDNQKNFSWNGDNDVEERKKAGAELAEMIRDEIKNLKEGEKVTLIAHSHGGNVVKYASQQLSKGELDRVIFLATPHRSDAKFNQTSLSKGGKVVNVYDPRDLVQSFFGKFDRKNINPLTPNAKRTMPSATNIKVKPEKIYTPNYLSPLEQDSYYNTSKTRSHIDSHSTIKNPEKWNESVLPLLRRK